MLAARRTPFPPTPRQTFARFENRRDIYDILPATRNLRGDRRDTPGGPDRRSRSVRARRKNRPSRKRDTRSTRRRRTAPAQTVPRRRRRRRRAARRPSTGRRASGVREVGTESVEGGRGERRPTRPASVPSNGHTPQRGDGGPYHRRSHWRASGSRRRRIYRRRRLGRWGRRRPASKRSRPPRGRRESLVLSGSGRSRAATGRTPVAAFAATGNSDPTEPYGPAKTSPARVQTATRASLAGFDGIRAGASVVDARFSRRVRR